MAAKPIVSLLQQAEEALVARTPPEIRQLFTMIHAINPTGRALAAAERRERYHLKNQLQSLLIRLYPTEIVVQNQDELTGVIGLAHRTLPLDACHTVLADLDDEARSWAQFQLDTAEAPPLGPVARGRIAQSTAETKGSNTVEDYLAQAEAALAEYDYDAAHAAFAAAFDASGGTPGTSLALLGFLVDTMANYFAALDTESRLNRRARKHPTVQAFLALAAANTGDIAKAKALAPDVAGARTAEIWTVLAQLYLNSGDFDAARSAVATARASGTPTTEMVAIEKKLGEIRSNTRKPLEVELAQLLAAGREDEALNKAAEILKQYPDSAPARRIVQRQEERKAQSERQAEVARADIARAARKANERQQLAEVVTLHAAGQYKACALAWLALSDSQQAAVQALDAQPFWSHLQKMAATGARKDDIAAAAPAATRASARGQLSDREMAALTAAHPALLGITEFRQAVAGHAAATQQGEREEQRRALQAAAARLQAGDLLEGRKLFETLPKLRPEFSDQRQALLEQLRALERIELGKVKFARATADDLWLEAADLAQKLSELCEDPAEAARWQTTAADAAVKGSAQWPSRHEVDPQNKRNEISALCSLDNSVPAIGVDARGRLVLRTFKAGYLFVELVDPRSRAVLRRAAIGPHGRPGPMVTSVVDDWLHGLTLDGLLLELDLNTLSVRRCRRLPMAEGEVIVQSFAIDSGHIWLLRLRQGTTIFRKQVIERDTLQVIYEADSPDSLDFPVVGLEPAAWADVNTMRAIQLRTARGRPHDQRMPDLPTSTPTLAVHPLDRHRVLALTRVQSGLGVKFYVSELPGRGPALLSRSEVEDVYLVLNFACSRATGLAVLHFVQRSSGKAKLAIYHRMDGVWHAARPFPAGTDTALVNTAGAGDLYVVADILKRSDDAAESGLFIHHFDGTQWSGSGLEEVENFPLDTEADPPKISDRPLRALLKENQLLDSFQPAAAWLAVLHAGSEQGTLQPQFVVDSIAQAKANGDHGSATTVALLALQWLRAAGQHAVAQELVQRLAPAERDCPEVRLFRADSAYQTGDFQAVEDILNPTIDVKWSQVESAHRSHLLAIAEVAQGGFDAIPIRMHQTKAFLGHSTFCQCEPYGWYRIADAAVRIQAGDEPTSWIGVELAAVYGADGWLELRQPQKALDTLYDLPLLSHPQAQTLARVLTAWLAVEIRPPQWFRVALAMATFLDCLLEPALSSQNTLIIPGAHWPRQKLQALAEQARQWLAANLQFQSDATRD